ncbi:MAG: multidrug efflux SMR transporter [Candidatus Kapabacteria bacterium]|nr:multidrug efflux SMR transporter [Ignavibacteriota bacterium]MCW5885568.1 multidrug efflux SMR transporter [Candidatus Kapabacteria bacterium]
MYWIILSVAGLFEVGWAVSMKLSEGFTNLKWTIITVILLIISMLGLGIAVKHLPVGTAYAVWTGIGAVGTAVLGIILFKESAEFWRIFFLLMIVCGIIGLKIVTK